MDLLEHLIYMLEVNGYLLRKQDDNFEISINGKLIVALMITSACLLIYISSEIFFRTFSITFRNISIYLRNLKKKDKSFWNLAFVRSFYAVFGFCLSGYERWFDAALKKDILNGQSIFSTLLISSHLGFFIFEVGALTLFDIKFKTFSKALHVHHLLALIGFILILYHNVNHYLGVSVFLLEGSSLFSCLCWCLIKANMEKSFLWKANQFILIHVFHLRSLFESIMIYEVFVNWTKITQMPLLLFIVQVGGLFAVAFFLTPYWTYKKTLQMFNPVDWSNNDDGTIKNKK